MGRKLDIPSGVPLYRPLSANTRLYFERALVQKRHIDFLSPEDKLENKPGFGIQLHSLMQEDYTTTAIYGTDALGFGIGGFATIKASKDYTVVVIEYSKHRVVKGFRAAEFRTNAQRELDIRDTDFRIGYGARLVLAVESRELSGTGTLFNYLNLGDSKSKRTSLQAAFQVVGVSSASISKAIPAAKIVSTKEEVNALLVEFQKLVSAIGDSFEATPNGETKAKAGVICTPTVLGAIEYVPQERVQQALGDRRDKGG